MAFSSIFQLSSLVCLTVQLLVLSDFARTTGIAVLENVCPQTRDQRLCLTYLRSDARSEKANLTELAQITIDKVQYDAVGFKTKIHALLLSAKDPKLSNLYRGCEGFYADALDALTVASDLLSKKRYDELKVNGEVVSISADRCEQLFGGKSPFVAGSKEVEVLGDVIVAISRSLDHA